MIFAFGGGFKGGDKADKGYIPYFEFLARNGFVVVSTDYRTTLKNLDPSKVSSQWTLSQPCSMRSIRR